MSAGNKSPKPDDYQAKRGRTADAGKRWGRIIIRVSGVRVPPPAWHGQAGDGVLSAAISTGVSTKCEHLRGHHAPASYVLRRQGHCHVVDMDPAGSDPRALQDARAVSQQWRPSRLLSPVSADPAN